MKDLTLLSKFDSSGYGTNLWNMFLTAIKQLLEKFIKKSESTQTPNSLVTCFMEMSNHLKLASFLKPKNLFVPNILSIMYIKSVLEAMVLGIFSFIDNLLNLEHGNHEDQDNILLHGMVLMHLCMLFTSK